MIRFEYKHAAEKIGCIQQLSGLNVYGSTTVPKMLQSTVSVNGLE